jgi:esterase/lipase superfamily enzyme
MRQPVVRATLFLIAFSVLASCSERGELEYSPEGNAEATGATLVPMLVATNRTAGGTRTGYSADRSGAMSYAEYQLSVPPDHEPGQIEWPGNATPDPARHFVTTDVLKLESEAAFVAQINHRLRKLPVKSRRLVVFAHGYNNNFAESLYRTVQIQNDLSERSVTVLFSWPSAGKGFAYLRDRDSVLYSRSDLADLLELAARTEAREVLISAHSVGSLLTMEALGEVVARRGRSGLSHVAAIALMSPDIDIDVFRRQVEKIAPLPQPFVVFTSTKDKALRFSAKLSSDQVRLGSLPDPIVLDDLDITFIDTTAFAESGDLNHLTAVTSPEVLAFLREIGNVKDLLDGDVAVNSGVAAGTVDYFQNATEVVLSAR